MALIRNTFETIRCKLQMFSGGRVLLKKDERNGIAQILLNRPDKRNAMTGQMMVDFRDCIEDLERWTTGKGVILLGNGSHFCAGGDLLLARAWSAQEGFDMCVWMQDALNRLGKLSLVSCCLLEGTCLGGGAEIPAFCDYTLATDGVKYGLLQGKVGIITAWGGGTALAQKIGKKKALELLLTSRIVNAEECLRLDIADAMVMNENALEEAVAWLTKKLSHDRTVTRAIKSVINNAQFYNHNEALTLEKEILGSLWGSSLHKKSIKL